MNSRTSHKDTKKARTISYHAQCSIKLNLTLRVLKKRNDGYHDIYSLFWRLPSPETLIISEIDGRGGDKVSCVGARIAGTNIVDRAISFVRGAAGPSIEETSYRVVIHKEIPTGSGVGAGSGNAAALLRWSAERWSDMRGAIDSGSVAKLGADVAFLASDHDLAVASGVGEKLTPIYGALDLHALIVFPSWKHATAPSYAALDRAFDSGAASPMSAKEASREVESIIASLLGREKVGLLPNDFIRAAGSRKKYYDELFDLFSSTSSLAWGMTGSGSAAFAIFAENESVRRAAAMIRDASPRAARHIYAVRPN